MRNKSNRFRFLHPMNCNSAFRTERNKPYLGKTVPVRKAGQRKCERKRGRKNGDSPKIPAKFHPITHLPETKVQKRRVAAYARVSTDSEEQQTSYAAQVDRYTKYIQERADWEFVAVYTDEGISALNTKHRDGFNRMVADALDGKIDLIVTKSVSRFARNTVDSLTTVRKLKEKGVEVFSRKKTSIRWIPKASC